MIESNLLSIRRLRKWKFFTDLCIKNSCIISNCVTTNKPRIVCVWITFIKVCTNVHLPCGQKPAITAGSNKKNFYLWIWWFICVTQVSDMRLPWCAIIPTKNKSIFKPFCIIFFSKRPLVCFSSAVCKCKNSVTN